MLLLELTEAMRTADDGKLAVTLETARSAIESDPDSAFVLAYDASRQALTGLLAHQGLRPTTKGGHYAVEQAVRAQFGPGFRQFGALRRRRNDLEYPERPGDDATNDEASEAVENGAAIVKAAQGLLDSSGCSDSAVLLLAPSTAAAPSG